VTTGVSLREECLPANKDPREGAIPDLAGTALGSRDSVCIWFHYVSIVLVLGNSTCNCSYE
jgi:hypothetical protein